MVRRRAGCGIRAGGAVGCALVVWVSRLSAAEFALDDWSLPVVASVGGYGGQFNQHVYAKLSAEVGVTLTNVLERERKVVALEPQLVRIFFNSSDFTVPDRMASFVRTAQLAQRAGATINICSGRLRLWPCGTCGSQERVQRFLRGPCAGGEEELLGVAAFSQLLPQAGRRSFPRPAGDTSSIRCRIPDDVRGLDDTPPDEAGALSNPGV